MFFPCGSSWYSWDGGWCQYMQLLPHSEEISRARRNTHIQVQNNSCLFLRSPLFLVDWGKVYRPFERHLCESSSAYSLAQMKHKPLSLCLVEVICLAPSTEGRHFSCHRHEVPPALGFGLEELVFKFLTVLKILPGNPESLRSREVVGYFITILPLIPSYRLWELTALSGTETPLKAHVPFKTSSGLGTP